LKPTFFKTQSAVRAWFKKNHDKTPELLMGFYIKDSRRGVRVSRTGSTYREALDEALCFGWIDGIRKAYDENSYTIRFTPRKAKSIWSAVNLKRAAELEQAGQMHAAGLAAFHGRDLSRMNLYSFENKERKLDAAQEKKFRANKKAWDWFSKQAPYYQRTASWWVISAKQDATRARRLETLIHDSEQGLKIASLRRAQDK
jgi:uncharacterized protein YdeI (YjbR/CyaY-like superfamily)